MPIKRKKINLNGDTPATQADLALWGGHLQEQINGLDKRMDKLEVRMDKLEERMERLEHGQERILDLLHSIDEQLKEYRDLPARVERLERSVFKR